MSLFYQEMAKKDASVASLHEEVWKTRLARFEAARRLRLQASSATWTIAIASALLIASSVAPRFGAADDSVLGTLSGLPEFVLSLVALVVSLIDGANDRRGRAALLYEHAVRLRRVLDALVALAGHATPEFRVERLQRLRAEYRASVERCNANHDPLDHDAAQARQTLRERPFDPAANWAVVRWLLSGLAPVVVLTLVATVAFLIS